MHYSKPSEQTALILVMSQRSELLATVPCMPAQTSVHEVFTFQLVTGKADTLSIGSRNITPENVPKP